MICFKCGTDAGRENVCPVCGADLEVFQRVMRLSNAYYNDGLIKAQVHNLSGAILSLQKSLKYNKYNIDARNLLGLVYYEMGEFVEAICEWVISSNFETEDNPANGYLLEMHKKGVIAQIDQTVRKYNQAIAYCEQGDRDLAEIQLKKVLSMSPRYVRAHQLLALLYMQDGQPDKAKKELRAAGKVDTDNTMTLRYLMECNRMIRESGSKKKQKDDDLLMFQSGNETIIMPKRFRESSLSSYLMYMAIGLALGIAVTSLLLVPQVRKTMLLNNQEQSAEMTATISDNNQTISDLQNQITDLQNQIGTAQASGESAESVVEQYQKLLDAYPEYADGKQAEAGEILAQIDTSLLAEEGLSVYNKMWKEVGDVYLKKIYDEAYDYYSKQDYVSAIPVLQQIVRLNEDYNEGAACCYLGVSLEETGDSESAQEYLRYVNKKYSGSEYASLALEYLNGTKEEPRVMGSDTAGDTDGTAGDTDGTAGTTGENADNADENTGENTGENAENVQ